MKSKFILLFLFFLIIFSIMCFVIAGAVKEVISDSNLKKDIKNKNYINELRTTDTKITKGDLTKEYIASEKELKIKDKEGELDIKLLTPYEVFVNIGEDVKVAEFLLIKYNKNSEESLYENIDLFNIKENYDKDNRKFVLKYLITDEDECVEEPCIFNETWVEFKSLKELPSPHKNIVIGLFTEVKSYGEHMEFVPTIKGFEILEWAGWIAGDSIVTGLTDVGIMSSPTVFQIGSRFHLISGDDSGVYEGFSWSPDTRRWVANSTMKTDLPDKGSYSKIDAFYWGTKLHAFLGGDHGRIYGYTWDGNSWVVNGTINASINDVGSFSSPCVFNTSATRWNLLMGERYGYIKGYTWNGTGWKTNATINASLIDAGDFATVEVFDIGTKINMLQGDYNSYRAVAWTWNGLGWTRNATANFSNTLTGLGYVDIEIFDMNSVKYAIIGVYTGLWYGYKWNFQPNITINSPLNTTYHNSKINFNITSVDDSDTLICVYSFDRGVSNYSLTRNSIYTGNSWDLSPSNTPYGITQMGDYFLIVDGNYDVVFKYDSNWTYINNWSTSPATNPYGITNDGNYLWISDNGNDEVYKFYMNGTYTGTSFDTAASGNGGPSGITQNGTYFWITDYADGYVYQYYINGTYKTYFDVDEQTTSNVWGIYTQNGTHLWIVSGGSDDEVYLFSGDLVYQNVHWNPAIDNPYGIFHNGSYFWITDITNDKVYQYSYPQSTTNVPNTCNTTDYSVGSGSKRLTVYCEDSTGINSVLERNFFMSVPDSTINSPLNKSYTTTTIEFNITAVVSDAPEMSTCWYSFNYGITNYTMSNLTATQWNATNSTMTQGKKDILFYCNDSLNSINQNFVSLFIDNIAPKVSIVSPANNTNSSDTELDIKYTYTEPNCENVTWNENSGANTTLASCGTNITTTTWSQGRHNITIFIRDIANNLNKTYVSFTIDNFGWDINSTINSSLPSFGEGGESVPSVFQKGSRWYLIAGASDGKFKGFSWNGTGWTKNATINASLPDIGSYSGPAVFNTSKTRFNLIACDTNAHLYGYTYNGTGWVKNATINASLPIFVGECVPAVFKWGSQWHLIVGEWNRGFKGYTYNGTGWTKNATINASLPTIYSPSPSVFQTGSQWHLISGNYYGKFNSFTWNGTGWTKNVTINSSLNDLGGSTAPSVFQMGSREYMVVGESFGTFNGFSWINDIDVNLTVPENNTYSSNTLLNLTSSIFDDIGIKNITFNIYNLTSGSLLNTTTINFGASVLTKTIGVMHTFVDGVYTWFTNAFDWASNSDVSENYTLTIDTVKPIITFLSPTPTNNSIVQDKITITANITDNSVGNTSTWIDFDRSLIGYWNFDNCNLTGCFDNSTYDKPQLFKRTCGPSNLTYGARGTGMYFTAMTANGGYMTSSSFNSATTNIGDEYGNWSVSLWVNFLGSTAYGQRLVELTTSGAYPLVIRSTTSGTGLAVNTYNGTSNPGTTTTSLTTNTWHHVAVRRFYNGTKRVEIYVDGVLNKSFTDTTKGDLVSTTWTPILGGTTGGDRTLNGSLDEVMIFNRSLSTDEILALYNSKINNYNNTFTNLGEGSHNYTIYSIDAAGNMNTTSREFITDLTRPIITFLSPTPENNSAVNQIIQTIVANITDDSNASAFIDFDNSLMGYWSFDKYNTTRIIDNSSWKRHGSYNGGSGVVNIVEGIRGKGMYFDGIDDSLSFSCTNMFYGYDNFTISYWQYPTGLASQTPIAFGWNYGDNLGVGLRPSSTGTYNIFLGSSSYNLNYNYGAELNKWTMLTIVHNNDLGKTYLYRNGVLYTTTNTKRLPFWYDGGTCNIGDENTNEFFGYMDEMMVFNRSLSAKEISAIYNTQSSNLTAIFKELLPGKHNYTIYTIDQAGNMNYSGLRGFNVSFNYSLDITQPTEISPTSTYSSENISVFFRFLNNLFDREKYVVINDVYIGGEKATILNRTSTLKVRTGNSSTSLSNPVSVGISPLPNTSYSISMNPLSDNRVPYSLEWASRATTSFTVKIENTTGSNEAANFMYLAIPWGLYKLNDTYAIYCGQRDYGDAATSTQFDEYRMPSTSYSIVAGTTNDDDTPCFALNGGSSKTTGRFNYQIDDDEGNAESTSNLPYCVFTRGEYNGFSDLKIKAGTTIQTSGNISVTFTTAFPDSNYVVFLTHDEDDGGDACRCKVIGRNTTTFRASCYDDGESNVSCNSDNYDWVALTQGTFDEKYIKNEKKIDFIDNILGWVAEITVPSFADGFKNLFINATLFGVTRDDTENLSIEYNFPKITFESPTPADNSNSSSTTQTIIANISDTNTTAFIDFDGDLLLWLGMEGNAVDNSSYGWSTTDGGVTFQDGKFGQSAGVFGSTEKISVNSSLDFASHNMTISFWMYVLNYAKPARQNPIGKAYGGDGTFTLETSGNINFYFGSAGSNAAPYTSDGSADVVTIGKWEHWAVTRNRDGRVLQWYKNGVPSGSAFSYSSTYDPVHSTNTLSIGDDYVNPLNGSIDEVMIFNRSLSADEIATLYNSKVNKFNATFSGLSEGRHDYTIYALDESHINSSSRGFTIDTTYPKISIVSPANNTNTSDSGLDIKYRYTELNCDNVTWNDGSGVNTTLASCGTNITIPTWGQGKHNITIFIRDTANNLNKTYVSFTIDTTSPDINLTTPANNTFTNNLSVNLTTEASDNIGIKNITFNIYNLTSGSLLNTTTINFGASVLTKTIGVMHTFVEGVYTWFTKTFDWAGNSDISTNYTLTIDTVRDIIKFLSPTPPDNSFIQDEIVIIVNTTDNSLGNTSTWIDMDGDLVGYWSMDSYNSSGIYDNSSYNEFGRFINGLSLSELDFGTRGNGINLNGNDQAINVSDSSQLDISGEEITILAWVYHTNVADDQKIITKGRGDGGATQGYKMGIFTNDKIEGEINTDGVSCANRAVAGGTVIAKDTWYLVGIIKNSTTMSSIVNGNLERGYACSGDITVNSNDLMIGRGSVNNGYSWNGSIDEVMIFNRALSQDELKAIYNSKVNNFNASFSSLSEGVHNYTIYSIDQAGNLNSTSRGFTTDLTKSIITFLSPTPANNSNLSSSTQTITANITDNIAGNISSWIDMDGDLVGYWSMDSYSSLKIYDNSSYENFGTFRNGLSINDLNFGARGKALRFDGVDDGLTINSASNLENMDEITINVWVNLNKLPSYSYIAGIEGTYKIDIQSNGKIRFLTGNNWAGSILTTTSSLTTNKWYNIIATYDGSIKKVYVNGILDITNVSTSGSIGSDSDNMTMGYRASADYANGSIDEVMIFNRSLSADEVSALYNSKVNNYNNTFTELAQGRHDYTVYAIDQAGNLNSTSRVFTIDTIYPKISMVSPANNTNTSDNELDIKYKYTELNCDNVTWNENSGANTTLASCGTNITTTTWSQGKHNITIFIRDIANNLNKTYVSFTIDTASPDINLTTPSNYTFTNNLSVNLTTEASDNIGIKNITFNIYNLTSGRLLNTTTVVFGSGILTKTYGVIHDFVDGVYKWFTKVYDWASNSDVSENYTLTIDSIYPKISMVSPANNTNSSDNGLDIKYKYTELNCDNVTWNDNNGINTTLASCGTNITIPTWAEGKHNITIFIRDIANNLNKTYVSFTIDTTGPIIISPDSQVLEYLADPLYADFNATDADSWWINWTSNLTIDANGILSNSSLLPFGNYYVNISANDSLGNIDSEIYNFNITDTTSPTISIVVPIIDYYNSSSFVQEVAYVYYGEPIDNCWYSDDGGAINYTIGCGTNLTGPWVQGQNNVTLYINDTYGNEASDIIHLIVDGYNPNVNLTTPLNGTLTSDTTQNLTSEFSDTWGIKNATLNIYNSSGNLVNTTTKSFGSGVLDKTLGIFHTFTDGIWKWFVKVYDWAGRTDTSDNNTLVIDTIDPIVNLVYPTNISYAVNISTITYTYTEIHCDRAWYSKNGGTLNYSDVACGTNFSGVVSVEGTNTWTIFMNDTAGNEGNDVITFFKDTLPPTFTDFVNQSIYDNQSISYDINATDVGIGLGTYSINWTTTFSINAVTGLLVNSSSLSEGNYYINISVNDTLGNTISDIMWINVTATDSLAPGIIKNYPVNYANLSLGTNVYFNFTATDDSEIDTCQLWTNTTGIWKKNYTWVNPTSGLMNFTILNIPEGIFKWNIWCNDSYNNFNFSISNYTLTIDETKPNMTISNTNNTLEPVGDLTVKVNYSVSDTHLKSCYYTLRNSVGAVTHYSENTSIDCSATSIQISALYFGTFVVQFWAEDYAGNLDDANFTFRTWSEGGGSGGGGGQQPEEYKEAKLNITLRIHYYNNGFDYIENRTDKYNSSFVYDGIALEILGNNSGGYNLNVSIVNATPTEFYKALPNTSIIIKKNEEKVLWKSKIIFTENYSEKENYTFFVKVEGNYSSWKTVYANDTLVFKFVKTPSETLLNKLGNLIWENNPLAGILVLSFAGVIWIFMYERKKKKKKELKKKEKKDEEEK